MKMQKKLILGLALLMMTMVYAQAQSGRGGRNMDPEQMAQRQTERLTEKLGLSEAQATKVGELNLSYANKMKEARDAAEGDFSTMRETMQRLRAEHKEELKQYLTEEQFATFEELEAQNQERRRNRRGQGKGGRNGAPAPDGGR